MGGDTFPCVPSVTHPFECPHTSILQASPCPPLPPELQGLIPFMMWHKEGALCHRFDQAVLSPLLSLPVPTVAVPPGSVPCTLQAWVICVSQTLESVFKGSLQTAKVQAAATLLLSLMDCLARVSSLGGDKPSVLSVSEPSSCLESLLPSNSFVSCSGLFLQDETLPFVFPPSPSAQFCSPSAVFSPGHGQGSPCSGARVTPPLFLLLFLQGDKLCCSRGWCPGS